MNHSTHSRHEKIKTELKSYLLDTTYLFFLLGAFSIYRKLLLEEYQLGYYHYGTTLIESLILAKILFIGRVMRIDRAFQNGPLVYPTFWKAFAFTILVGIFTILEAAVDGLVHGQGAIAGLHQYSGHGQIDLMARCVVTFFALIPFFALQEIGERLGSGKLFRMFFHDRNA